MVLLNQESRLLTGSADSELRAWDIQYIQEVRTLLHFYTLNTVDEVTTINIKNPTECLNLQLE